MVPFRQFVLKVHSRCNLACDYCYVYEMADQSWRAQPHRMSEGILDHTVKRIAEHADAHQLESIAVVLHGGEPLLAGTGFLTNLVQRMRAATSARVDVSMQTNGVLLNEQTIEALVRHKVRVGVSLDGNVQATDRHRRFPDGRGSHTQVDRALRLLGQDRFLHCYAGLLCTIDLANDPVATYEALLEYAPPTIDLLLPHGTWSSPPPKRDPASTDTPYADWLLKIFDRWYANPETSVRLFREIVQLHLGGIGAVEGLGLRPSTVIVVDTDGAIKQLDSLAAAYPGAADTGLHVAADSFDAALAHPLTVLRQGGIETRGEVCRSCTILQTCGGGLFTHRFRIGHGFVNPSVYCPDLLRLISVIRNRVASDLWQTVQ
jgi:uncharacterized protein